MCNIVKFTWKICDHSLSNSFPLSCHSSLHNILLECQDYGSLKLSRMQQRLVGRSERAMNWSVKRGISSRRGRNSYSSFSPKLKYVITTWTRNLLNVTKVQISLQCWNTSLEPYLPCGWSITIWKRNIFNISTHIHLPGFFKVRQFEIICSRSFDIKRMNIA